MSQSDSILIAELAVVRSQRRAAIEGIRATRAMIENFRQLPGFAPTAELFDSVDRVLAVTIHHAGEKP